MSKHNKIRNICFGGADFFDQQHDSGRVVPGLPLAVYFISGRWFVRGIAAGAVKG